MRFLKLTRLLLVACVAALSVAASAQAKTNELEGKTLYTQVNIYSLKGEVVTWVNYHVDTLIPVNSEVTINKISDSSVTFTVKATGQKLKLKNKERHSGLDGLAWAQRHFGANKVDLNRFSKAERDAIEGAQVQIGMSKAAVLVAYGYPPAHKTPSLESSTWLYWINRWNKIAVRFDDKGYVVSVQS